MDTQEELKALKQWSKVKTWRDRGIDARWFKIEGVPVMILRPQYTAFEGVYNTPNCVINNQTYTPFYKKDYNRIEQFIMEGKTLQEATVLHYSLKNRQM
jgi:hypothetical protein